MPLPVRRESSLLPLSLLVNVAVVVSVRALCVRLFFHAGGSRGKGPTVSTVTCVLCAAYVCMYVICCLMKASLLCRL